jgi:hypothetical protein
MGDRFHRESGQALLGENLERGPQHPLPGPRSAGDGLARRWLFRGVSRAGVRVRLSKAC